MLFVYDNLNSFSPKIPQNQRLNFLTSPSSYPPQPNLMTFAQRNPQSYNLMAVHDDKAHLAHMDCS